MYMRNHSDASLAHTLYDYCYTRFTIYRANRSSGSNFMRGDLTLLFIYNTKCQKIYFRQIVYRFELIIKFRQRLYVNSKEYFRKEMAQVIVLH